MKHDVRKIRKQEHRIELDFEELFRLLNELRDEKLQIPRSALITWRWSPQREGFGANGKQVGIDISWTDTQEEP